MVNFGNRLKQLRLTAHISQVTLAKRLNVTKSMVSAYENAVRMPSYDVLVKIAAFFNVSIDYMLGFDGRSQLDITGLSDAQIKIISQLISHFKSEGAIRVTPKR